MKKTEENMVAFLAGLTLFFACLVSFDAMATYKKDGDTNAEAQATSEATAEATAGSSSYSEGSTSSSSSQGGAASASNDGVTVEGDKVENNSSNVVLVPNNNTESCVRVFGLAFGKNGESGAIGLPWRSAKCDFEQAADDAFAAGERDIGWFWKCQNKNLYKRFKSNGESAESAIDDCHTRMLATTSRDEIIHKLEDKLRATENLLELERSHKSVCDESLDRCQEKAYGDK